MSPVARSFAPNVDLEDFTRDGLGVTHTAPAKPGTWAAENRARHPKHYLQYLTASEYRETKQGVAALNALEWHALLERHPTHLRFLRSFIRDLAHGLEDDVALPPGPEHEATSLKLNVLRNA